MALWKGKSCGTVSDVEPNAAAVIGQRIRDLREQRHMSLDVLYAETCSVLPRTMWMSTEKIRRIEKGDRLPEPVELSAIVAVFGITVGDLAPEMLEDVQTVRDLIERTVPMLRWITANPGQGSLLDLLVAA